MKKILIVAGEVSGDNHGAELVASLNKIYPDIKYFGIGGDDLQANGMQILVHLKKMAFLGIGEVIRHLPYIRKVHNQLIEAARREKPDCAILIDYPGFNLRVARSLEKLGVPVIYYISPQLWAWGKRRVEKIRRYVSEMLVLFPFEEEFYAKHGIDAKYVGHPVVDKHFNNVPAEPKKVDPNQVVLGLLPGSRKQEVLSLLPKMIETARDLKKKNKIQQARILKVTHLPDSYFNQLLNPDDGFISIIEKKPEEVLPDFDAVLVASGTATLETGYFGVPMVIVYHVNRLTYWLGRLLIKVKFIGLVNIVAGEEVAPELIQQDFTVKRASALLEKMIIPKENLYIRRKLATIKEKLGQPGAAERAARAIRDFLDRPADL